MVGFVWIGLDMIANRVERLDSVRATGSTESRLARKFRPASVGNDVGHDGASLKGVWSCRYN